MLLLSLMKKEFKKILYRKYYKMCPGFMGGGIGIDLSRCRFEDHVWISHHAQAQDSFIGNYSSLGRYNKVREADIGRYCSISWDVTIGAPTHPYKSITNSGLTYRKEYGFADVDSLLPQKRTTIGNDVWIGCDVTIIAGVTIGDGAIIGAGAVVTKDVAPYEIWAGVPAKKIGTRFEDRIVKVLEEIKWWNWSHDEIEQCIDLFNQDLDYEIVLNFKETHERYFSGGNPEEN